MFANDAQFLDLVNGVLKESGIVALVNPFKYPKVLAALLSLLGGVVGLDAKAFGSTGFDKLFGIPAMMHRVINHFTIR